MVRLSALAVLPARKCTAASLALATTLLTATAALACSLPPPLYEHQIAPAPNEPAPTNSQIRLRYHGSSVDGFETALSAPEVRDEAGQVLDVDVETSIQGSHTLLVLLKPKAPLPAGGKVTVFDRFDEPGWSCFDPSCLPAQLSAFATLTVAQEADNTPPTFDGLDAIDTAWDECDNDGCCGPYAGYRAIFKYNKATDDGPHELLYNVYRRVDAGLELVASHVKNPSGASSGGYLSANAALGVLAEGDYVLKALDIAGNESDNEEHATLLWPTTGGGGVDAGGAGDVADSDAGGTGGGTDVTPGGGDAVSGGDASSGGSSAGKSDAGGCTAAMSAGHAGGRSGAVSALMMVLGLLLLGLRRVGPSGRRVSSRDRG
jgi:hypothetical protein